MCYLGARDDTVDGQLGVRFICILKSFSNLLHDDFLGFDAPNKDSKR